MANNTGTTYEEPLPPGAGVADSGQTPPPAAPPLPSATGPNATIYANGGGGRGRASSQAVDWQKLSNMTVGGKFVTKETEYKIARSLGGSKKLEDEHSRQLQSQGMIRKTFPNEPNKYYHVWPGSYEDTKQYTSSKDYLADWPTRKAENSQGKYGGGAPPTAGMGQRQQPFAQPPTMPPNLTPEQKVTWLRQNTPQGRGRRDIIKAGIKDAYRNSTVTTPDPSATPGYDAAAPVDQADAAQQGATSTQSPNPPPGVDIRKRQHNANTQFRSQRAGYQGNRRFHPFGG